MSSHLPTHKSFLHIKCIIHWPNCTRLTRQIWGKLKPTYIIPTVQVDTLTNSKAAEPRRPSLTCCTITYHLHNHQISSSQSSRSTMSLITHHIETDEGHHNHVKLFVRDDPEYDCLQKLKCHKEFFLKIVTWGPQFGLGSAFTGFFPPAFFIAAMYLRR